MKGNTKKAISFYLTIIAAILSVVGIVLYGSVMYRLTEVYYMLIAAVVLAVIAIVLPMVIGDKAVFNLIPVLNAVLMASAVVWGTNLMVNQLGYVYAGLDGIDTIMSYIYYVAVVAIAMLLNIVASFLPMAKEAA
jgi:hypothetical protein